MQTITIDIINDKVMKLLQDLELLHLIHVRKDTAQTDREATAKNSITPKKKPSDFFGTLSREDGEKMQAYVTQSRNEWERNS